MPAVHHSSFNVARALAGSGQDPRSTVDGFLRQVTEIAPGIDALIERAVSERTRIVIEGVHLLPDVPNPRLQERAITVQALLAVRDEEAHRAHFHMRSFQAPRPPGRYLEAFDRIRVIQDYLIDRAEEAGIPTVDEGGLEPTLKRVMEVVLDALAAKEAPLSEPSLASGNVPDGNRMGR
jgi:2-phosphoglycerate kinase